jgi:hypothetical protein
LQIAHQKHDIIPVVISDPREAELPDAGLLILEDLETGETALVDSSSARVREAYRTQHEARVAQRRQLFRSMSLDSIEVATDEPVSRPLMRFFRARERRLSEGR